MKTRSRLAAASREAELVPVAREGLTWEACGQNVVVRDGVDRDFAHITCAWVRQGATVELRLDATWRVRPRHSTRRGQDSQTVQDMAVLSVF